MTKRSWLKRWTYGSSVDVVADGIGGAPNNVEAKDSHSSKWQKNEKDVTNIL
jgi:hypothetical protein